MSGTHDAQIEELDDIIDQLKEYRKMNVDYLEVIERLEDWRKWWSGE